jgi:hypothetical protein
LSFDALQLKIFPILESNNALSSTPTSHSLLAICSVPAEEEQVFLLQLTQAINDHPWWKTGDNNTKP